MIPAGSYAIEIADFFSQCKGIIEGHLTKSFHGATVQIICILLVRQSQERNSAIARPLEGFIVPFVMFVQSYTSRSRESLEFVESCRNAAGME